MASNITQSAVAIPLWVFWSRRWCRSKELLDHCLPNRWRFCSDSKVRVFDRPNMIQLGFDRSRSHRCRCTLSNRQRSRGCPWLYGCLYPTKSYQCRRSQHRVAPIQAYHQRFFCSSRPSSSFGQRWVFYWSQSGCFRSKVYRHHICWTHLLSH